jgi:hypothetical protein
MREGKLYESNLKYSHLTEDTRRQINAYRRDEVVRRLLSNKSELEQILSEHPDKLRRLLSSFTNEELKQMAGNAFSDIESFLNHETRASISPSKAPQKTTAKPHRPLTPASANASPPKANKPPTTATSSHDENSPFGGEEPPPF